MRKALVALALIASVPVWPGSPVAATTTVTADDEQTLVDTYAPVLVVGTQPESCGPGEPYVPVPVDAVLGRDDVQLRSPAGEVVAAPTRSDLAVATDDTWHLDLPGRALRPGCSYETWHDSLGATPTTYARIATDPERPGVLVVQYWFFYVYNDWNDRHEGDWEMVQLLFEAADPSEALEVGPYLAAYAQHEGAELSAWDDGSLQTRDGTHPLVFVAQGSHASYFSSERWFGASAQSGFGCDDTRAPTTAVRPEVAVLDEAASDWLAYPGRWGEKQPSFNNGPTGPATKTQWDAPVRWVEDEGRDGAVALPASGTVVTDFFCSASRAGSVVFMRFLDEPWRVVLAVVVAVVALALLARRTRWRAPVTSPLVAPRAVGQVWSGALRVVRRRWRLLAPIGALNIAAGAVAAGLQTWITPRNDLGDAADLAEVAASPSSARAALLGALVFLPAVAVVGTATHLALRALDEGRAVRPAQAIRAAVRLPRAIVAQVVTAFLLTLSVVSVVFLPVAVWATAALAVVVPASIDAANPWRESRHLTRGRRLPAWCVSTVNGVAVSVVPALVGTLVLLLANWSFAVVNLIAGVVAAVVVPTTAVVTALFHGDLQARRRA